jgi:hypothetical protein
VFKELVDLLFQGLKIQLKFLPQSALFTVPVAPLSIGESIRVEGNISSIILGPFDTAIVLDVSHFTFPASGISVVELVLEVVEGCHRVGELFADLRVHLNSGVIFMLKL